MMHLNRNVKPAGGDKQKVMRWCVYALVMFRHRSHLVKVKEEIIFWVNLVLLSQTWLEIVQMPRVASHLQIQKHRSFVWPPSHLAVT